MFVHLYVHLRGTRMYTNEDQEFARSAGYWVISLSFGVLSLFPVRYIFGSADMGQLVIQFVLGTVVGFVLTLVAAAASERFRSVVEAIGGLGLGVLGLGVLIWVVSYYTNSSTQPRTAADFYERAMEYAAQQEHEKAIIVCNKAIELDPNYSDAYILRGDLWSKNWVFYDKAIDDYTMAIHINPKDSRAFQRRGEVWKLKGLKRIQDSGEPANEEAENARRDIVAAERLRKE